MIIVRWPRLHRIGELKNFRRIFKFTLFDASISMKVLQTILRFELCFYSWISNACSENLFTWDIIYMWLKHTHMDIFVYIYVIR